MLSGADFADWANDFDDDVHFSAGILLETCLYGIYLLLFIISTYNLLKGGNRNTGPTILQLSAFCSMFALSTGLWAMDVASLFLSFQIDRLTLSPSPEAGEQSDRLIIISEQLIFATKFLFEVNFLIGDLLIAWRVLVLYRSQPAVVVWVRAVFAILWLAAFGLVLRETACWAATMLTDDPPLCSALRQAAWATSLVLNFFASLLTWNFIRRRGSEIRQCAPDVKASAHSDFGFGKTKVDRVLYILLVSSAVYIALGLSTFLSECGLGGERLAQFAYFMDPATDQLVAMYPSIVTIFVLCQDAILGPLTLAGSGTTASIGFNVDDVAASGVSNASPFGTATFDASLRASAVDTVHSHGGDGEDAA